MAATMTQPHPPSGPCASSLLLFAEGLDLAMATEVTDVCRRSASTQRGDQRRQSLGCRGSAVKSRAIAALLPVQPGWEYWLTTCGVAMSVWHGCFTFVKGKGKRWALECVQWSNYQIVIKETLHLVFYLKTLCVITHNQSVLLILMQTQLKCSFLAHAWSPYTISDNCSSIKVALYYVKPPLNNLLVHCWFGLSTVIFCKNLPGHLQITTSLSLFILELLWLKRNKCERKCNIAAIHCIVKVFMTILFNLWPVTTI